MIEEDITLAKTWVERLREAPSGSLPSGVMPITKEAHRAILEVIEECGRTRRAVIPYPSLALRAALNHLSLSSQDFRSMIELIVLGNLQNCFFDFLNHPQVTLELRLEMLFAYASRPDIPCPSIPPGMPREVEYAQVLLEGFPGAPYSTFRENLQILIDAGESSLEVYRVLWSDAQARMPIRDPFTDDPLGVYNAQVQEIARTVLHSAVYLA